MKNPIGDPLGRGGEKSGWVRCTVFEGAQTKEDNLHAEARRDVVGGSSERRGLIQGNDAFLDTE